MAKAKAEEKQETTALALPHGDALAAVGVDFEVTFTGTEGQDASDFSLGTLAWNMTTFEGEDVTRKTIINTQTGEQTESKKLRLLVLHKSRELFEGEGNDRKKTCSSWDRATGTTDDGRTRPCAGCVYAGWSRDPKTGKNKQQCAEVTNVVALEENDTPVLVKFRRTGAKAWRKFTNRYVFKKREVRANGPDGPRTVLTDYPLFAFEVLLTTDLETYGKNSVAVPRLEVLRVCAADEIKRLMTLAREIKEVFFERVRAVAVESDANDAAGGDGSFDVDGFADDSKGAA